WRDFQETFEEGGLEVYQSRSLMEIPHQLEIETVEEHNRLKMNELFERARNRYYNFVDQGDIEEVKKFIEHLEEVLKPILE
ncbi:4555_t:CDS:1, partial [Ambispora gerdemannii]